ncbi:hypothetical protein SO802_032967 [Lithocarpus litseifolius]|uniref:Uncharacterized protein n=1 Tax=Lithocarpus litseifolius TaxID=425828 RepID=A0AAW2BC98_9ROSI
MNVLGTSYPPSAGAFSGEAFIATKDDTSFLIRTVSHLMLKLTERSSWEVGEGSGSNVSAEKIPKLSPSTDELDGDLIRTDGCVDEIATHVSTARTQISEGSNPHGSAEKPLMVFLGIGEMGGVLIRSDGCGGKVGAVGGHPVDPESSKAEVDCMGFSGMVADGPAEDFPNSGAVLNSEGQLVHAKPSASLYWFLAFLDEEILLLDWVNPTGSGKDEDGGNALVYVPLAKWDPQGGMELVSEEAAVDDFLVGEDLEPSVWVKRKIKGFSKFVGFLIDTCEQQCIALFQKLEKVWEKQATVGSCATMHLHQKKE